MHRLHRTLSSAALLVTAAFIVPRLEAQDTAVFQARGAFLAISVPNADSSRAWYMSKLGMREIFRSGQNGVRVIVLSGGGLTVEILEKAGSMPLRTAAPTITDQTLVHGPFKAGVYVENFDLTIQRLRQRGVPIYLGPFPPANGLPANALIRDNYGNLIQFFGR